MEHIKRCHACGEYTLKDTCKTCSGKTEIIRPPKYSPEDKYGEYRRKALKDTLKGKGLA
jgi:H/ACA ribonucleoprotein complex subunit 3